VARWAGADEILVGAVQRKEDGPWMALARTSATGWVIATVDGSLKRPDSVEELAKEALLASATEPGLAAAPGPNQPSAEPARASAPMEPRASSSGSNTGWLLGGAGVGAGQSALLAEAGFPGLQGSLLYGLSERVDVGALAAIDFGFDGILDSGISGPGLRLGAILRVNILSEARFNLGLRLSPQVALYVPSPTTFGVLAPLELAAGLPLTPEVSLHFAFSLPVFILVSPSTVFALSFLPGVGLEYKIDGVLSLTLDTRIGPAFDLTDGANHLQIRALAGVGYRF
jgi:hypothetical protein